MKKIKKMKILFSSILGVSGLSGFLYLPNVLKNSEQHSESRDIEKADYTEYLCDTWDLKYIKEVRRVDNGAKDWLYDFYLRKWDYPIQGNISVSYSACGHELFLGFDNEARNQLRRSPDDIKFSLNLDFKSLISKLEEIFRCKIEVTRFSTEYEDIKAISQINFNCKVDKIDRNTFTGYTYLEKISMFDLNKIGPHAFRDCLNLKDIVLTKPAKGCGVEIGYYAFKGCENLTQINAIMKKGIRAIDDGTFYNCKKLQSVILASEVTEIPKECFYNCEKLQTVSCAYYIEKIGNFAFYNCNSLTIDAKNSSQYRLTLSSKSIGNFAFTNCYNLKTLDVSERCESIGSGGFENCINLSKIKLCTKMLKLENFVFNGCKNLNFTPSDLSKIIIYGSQCLSGTAITSLDLSKAVGIQYGAFKDCTLLKTVTYSKNVNNIPDSAFDGDASLQKITNITHITSIADFAFRGTALTTVSIPKGVTTEIGYAVFKDCKSLETVYLNKLKVLKPSLFEGCQKLYSISWNNEITSIPERCFSNCGFQKVTLPSSIKSIGPWAFSQNYNLTSFTFPKNFACETLPSHFFFDCFKLVNVYNINNFASFGSYAFFNTAIKSFSMPANGVKIDEYCFGNCWKLTSVNLNNCISIQKGAFSGTGITEIKLPSSIEKSLSNFDYLFQNCSSLKNVYVYCDINFGEEIFYNCSSLEKVLVYYNSSNIQVGENAFSGTDQTKFRICFKYPDLVTYYQWLYDMPEQDLTGLGWNKTKWDLKREQIVLFN